MAALWALAAYGAYANYDGDNSGSNYGGSNGSYGSPSPSYPSYGNYGSYGSSPPSPPRWHIHNGVCNPNGTTSDPRECSGGSQYAGSTADAFVLCCESIPTHLYSTQTHAHKVSQPRPMHSHTPGTNAQHTLNTREDHLLGE